jgi:alpha-galactosidase
MIRQFVFVLALTAAALAFAESPVPRLNNPATYGAHPGRPFLYTIPAVGTRPMEFSAKGLPEGLKLDASTGRITGAIAKKGEYRVTLRAKNRHGAASSSFRIVAGDTLALTPPMGWSTWYMAYANITDAMVRAQADAMVSTGLINHGYQYINIDDGWNIKLDAKDDVIGGPPRDAAGNLRTNKNFPDMKALCDYVHSKGLKIGIYIGPGPRTCAGYEGSLGHEEQDARQFAAWGFDFLKYDLCSYGKLIKDPKSREEHQKPYRVMQAALQKVDRDFVYNLCQYGRADVWEWGREVGGNFWRTTGDVGAAAKQGLWAKMSEVGFSQAGKEKWAGPGGWNDPDNILIGQILWNRQLMPTPLTPDEQYTWVSLWSLLASPLVFGGDMTKLDDFSLSLLTNDELIAVNQDPLGRQGAPVSRADGLEVWAKNLSDGSKAVGLFNRGPEEKEVTAKWSDLGINGKRKVRDLWKHKDLGAFQGRFTAKVPSHGAVVVRVR